MQNFFENLMMNGIYISVAVNKSLYYKTSARSSSLSDFENRREKTVKSRPFLFEFEANIEIFNDNSDINGPTLAFV